MQVKITYNLNRDIDAYKYKVASQAVEMLSVLQSLTGRYCGGAPCGYKNLIKYDGIDAYTKRAIEAIKKEYGEDDVALKHRDDFAAIVVHYVVSDLEDEFYDVISEHKVDLDAGE